MVSAGTRVVNIAVDWGFFRATRWFTLHDKGFLGPWDLTTGLTNADKGGS